MALDRMQGSNSVASLGPGRLIADARLVGADTSDPTVDEGGRGFSVSRDDVGKYTVTISNSGGLTPVAILLTFEQGAAGHKKVSISSRDDSAGTFQVNVRTEGSDTATDADVDLQSDEYVHICATLKTTSVAD